MKLLPTETELRGQWLSENGRLVGDQVSIRIAYLVQSHLRKLGCDASGWDTLYLDPDDGRLWELVYRESDLHGGGAPELRRLEKAEAAMKYGCIVPDST